MTSDVDHERALFPLGNSPIDNEAMGANRERPARPARAVEHPRNPGAPGKPRGRKGWGRFKAQWKGASFTIRINRHTGQGFLRARYSRTEIPFNLTEVTRSIIQCHTGSLGL